MNISSISTVDYMVKQSQKMTKSPIFQFVIFKQSTSFKIVELNRASIFFHEIFRINVELNFDLKSWSRILKKFGDQILKFARHFSEFVRQIF